MAHHRRHRCRHLPVGLVEIVGIGVGGGGVGWRQWQHLCVCTFVMAGSPSS